MTNTTLKKISEVLGISISTVSRALKNHPDISTKTKQKVVELAQTLDYEPNANAVNLRTSNSKLFGVIVPSVSSYFYDSFIAALEEECRNNDYRLMILQSGDDPDIELNNVKLCRQNRVTGLFACLTPQTKDVHHFLKLNELNIPVVFFDKVPDIASCNKVCVADTDAASIAARAIRNKNKKNVLAIFGSKELSITKKRLEAFSKILNKNEVNFDLQFALNNDQAQKITEEALQKKNPPDTIFCMSDEILIGAMKAIQEANLSIPSEIGIIAISNGFFPKLYYPEITYVETSAYKLGKLAFTGMMACVAGTHFTQELTVQSLLIEGGSL
ncbi:MAG: LacI family DNA-binding transcriptional regulator [Bacteroidota bacterium]|nr:LacI family DNA-binding transcriptional regulator [Bacteroidota bacterium]